jgi:CRP-like cAMP-binding protein
LFADENHIATAVTLEDSVIANVTMEFIQNKALKNSEFSLMLLRKFARELGFANIRTVTLTQKHIRGRLAESLILLADKYGFEHDNTTLKVYMSREDIANLSNMTTSNAIRTLSTFANEKLITIDGRKIKILDLYRLDRISKLG